MGFRFQRRIKILPGVRLNVSKSGVSTSVGTKGAQVTVGRGQRRTTVGIPGTGLSYTSVEQQEQTQQLQNSGIGKIVALVIVAVLVIAWVFG